MMATGVARPGLLGVGDLAAGEFEALLDLAALMKRHPLAWQSTLAGRAVACVFEHPATRDRVSLEVAVHRLGALPVVVQPTGDSLVETARALSACCDGIVVRTTRHRDLLDFVEHASVPVVNALSNREHPCQALADCLHLRERFGRMEGLRVAYVGAREPAMHSFIEAAMLTGITIRIAAPTPLLPDPALLSRAGETVQVCDTVSEAIAGVDAVYRTGAPRSLDALANLVPVEQAVLRVLVTGDWEA